MDISRTNQFITIDQNLKDLDVSGANNKIVIKSRINNIYVSGLNNSIDGTDPNCFINYIDLSGIKNTILLNNNCLNVNKNNSGIDNNIQFIGSQDQNTNNNNGNYYKLNNPGQNNNNIEINNFQANDNNSNNNNANENQANNSVSKKNILASVLPGIEDTSNLSDFDKKKRNLFLEMDEYQYKHIQRYESRKETECAICLEEFKGVDIIKAFYKCEHIFHKNCLRDWLQRANECPLCKRDLTEDINKMK